MQMNTKTIMSRRQPGTPTLGGRRGSCPLCPHPWEAGGAIIAFDVELFPFLLYLEGALSDIVDSLVQENFSKGKPPDPQLCTVFLGDQYTKHCSSRKGIVNQNLTLWRKIQIHRCALTERLAPLPNVRTDVPVGSLWLCQTNNLP